MRTDLRSIGTTGGRGVNALTATIHRYDIAGGDERQKNVTRVPGVTLLVDRVEIQNLSRHGGDGYMAWGSARRCF